MKVLIFLISILLASCNPKDSENQSDKIRELGKSKMETAKREADLNKDRATAKRKMNFEDQLSALKELGIQLTPDIDINEIFDGEFGKSDYEEEGILFTLREFGRPKFKKDKGKVYFSKNAYTLVSEDFNIDKFAFVDLLKNISRITNQTIVFEDIKFENSENAVEEKKISFKIEETLMEWTYNYNEGYFDANLIPKLCEVLKKKGVNSLFWSEDGLSHTLLVGDLKFIGGMSKYLNKQPC